MCGGVELVDTYICRAIRLAGHQSHSVQTLLAKSIDNGDRKAFAIHPDQSISMLLKRFEGASALSLHKYPLDSNQPATRSSSSDVERNDAPGDDSRGF